MIKKILFFSNLLCLILVSMASVQAGDIQSTKFNVDIRSQKVDQALLNLAETSGIQMVFSGDKVDIESQRVKGNITVDEALKQLLRNTGLTYEVLSDKLIVVKKEVKVSQLLEEETAEASEDDAVDDNVLKVIGKRIIKRDRLNTIEPTLVYDINFFQRFEPTDITDILKRVPGVTFDSFFKQDVNTGVDGDDNDDGIAFRGTTGQVLINGRRLPGTNFDGSIALSSIPADIIKEVRVIRAPTALIDSQGAGLTVDVILKNGANIPVDSSSNYRATYSSAQALENTASEDGFDFTGEGSFESETLSLNSNLQFYFDNDSELLVEALYSQTDSFADVLGRTDIVFDNPLYGPPVQQNFDSSSKGDNDLFSLAFTHTLAFGDDILSTLLSFDGAESTNDNDISSFVTDTQEITLDVRYQMAIQDNQQLTFGVKFDDDSTDTVSIATLGNPATGDNNRSVLTNEEEGLDFYAQYEINFNDAWSWSVGARYQSFDYSVDGQILDVVTFSESGYGPYLAEQQVSFPVFDVNNQSLEDSSTQVNSHVRWRVSEEHDIRLSYSEAIELPDINSFVPTRLVERNFDGGVNIMTGNDNLGVRETDTIELGWDWNSENGHFGFSIFDKSVAENFDLITVFDESLARQVASQVAGGIYLAAIDAILVEINALPASFQPSLIGYSILANSTESNDYKGVEIDFSFPLSSIGLENASFTSNISYQDLADSRDNDPLFFNATLDHLIESIGLTYGISYNKRNDEKDVTTFNTPYGPQTTIRETLRDASIDVFVQKRINDTLVLRLTGENINSAVSSSIVQIEGGGPTTIIDEPIEGSRTYALTVRGSF